jgi:hypothetical protein
MIELSILVVTLVILAMLLTAASIFYSFIYAPFKIRSRPFSFEEAFAILKLIIQTELDAYNADVFRDDPPITNSNFVNFYTDLTEKIRDNISPALMEKLTEYIPEELVYKLIVRQVKDFLVSKVQ